MSSLSTKPGADLIGSVIGECYTVLDVLGKGGFGLVLKVEHNTLKTIQALKLLSGSAAGNAAHQARFEREARAVAQLDHENIVDINDFGRDETQGHYFVMELLDGLELAEVIEREGPMPAPRVIHIVKQVCEALSVVHAENIVHRDLKPANIILLQRPGRPDFVKVLDFGIAAMKLDEGEERPTQVGLVVGSPCYMAPEQAQGKDLTPRSDLYALGVIMYQMLVGRVPFHAQSALIVIRKHLREQPQPFHAVRSDLQIPASVERIVMRLLEKDPGARFPSADAVMDALKAVESEVGVVEVASEELETPAAIPALAQAILAEEQEGGDAAVASPAKEQELATPGEVSHPPLRAFGIQQDISDEEPGALDALEHPTPPEAADDLPPPMPPEAADESSPPASEEPEEPLALEAVESTGREKPAEQPIESNLPPSVYHTQEMLLEMKSRSSRRILLLVLIPLLVAAITIVLILALTD